MFVGQIGAGIQCPPNATVLFEHWGIFEEIKTYSLEPQKRVMRSYRGATLLTQRTGSLIKDAYGVPYLLVHRAALLSVLVQRAENLGIAIHLGCDVAKADIDFHNASIRLENGNRFDGDLIIGADGERSVSRAQLLGHYDEVESNGELIFRIKVPEKCLAQHSGLRALAQPGLTNYWMGPDSHAVSYMMRRENWLNVVVTVPQDASEEVVYGAQSANIGDLITKLKNWDRTFIDLLRLGEGCAKWNLLQSKENRNWLHAGGKFVLVGDSAHAMLPYLAQGAAQGFEDAAVLGELFSHIEHKSQITKLLELYVRLRLERSMLVKQRSHAMREMFGMPDGPSQQERDRMLSLGRQKGAPFALDDPDFQSWLWGYNAIKETRNLLESSYWNKT